MNILVGIFDKLAKKYIHTLVIENVEVFRREIKNVVNTPSKNPMYTNAEDFECHILCTVDQFTGDVTVEKQLAFDFAGLKNPNVNK